MFQNLTIYHGTSHSECGDKLGALPGFILQTCQRRLVASLEPLPWAEDQGMEAHCGVEGYRFLLEVVCGLHSKLLGESEVLAQFRQAFQNYLASPHAQNELIKIFEKILKDAKEVRTRYLMGIGKNSYGGLVRRLLQPLETAPVLVIGSGDLAYQILTNLKKRHPLLISARSSEKLPPLLEKFGAQVASWKDYDLWVEMPLIVNTIGTDETLFDQTFFQQWAALHPLATRCFIDLGQPSPLATPWRSDEGVLRLQELLGLVENLSAEKSEKIANAREFISELAHKRQRIFSPLQVPIRQELRYL